MFYLIEHHPLLLISLEARNRNLLLVADKVALLPFLTVGVARRMLSDPLFFLLGHFYGDNALRWAERRLGGGDVLVKLTEDWFRKASGVMVFLFPGALVCVLAGVSRMRIRTFFVLNFLGTLTMVIVLRLFAHALRGPIDAFQEFNSRNFKWLTAISIVLVVGYLLFQRLTGTGELESFREIEEELEGGEGSKSA